VADEALDLHRTVLQMGRPSDLQLALFKQWMKRPTLGNVYLSGDDKDIWFESEKDDLITVWRPDSSYSVTSTLSKKLVYYYHRFIGARIHVSAKTGFVCSVLACLIPSFQAADEREYIGNSVVYQDDRVFKVLKALATVTASLLPIVGIVVLYQIQSMSIRLAVIAAFTAGFSLCLNLITTATVKDIFQATAT
jgi:hypothetical protein